MDTTSKYKDALAASWTKLFLSHPRMHPVIWINAVTIFSNRKHTDLVERQAEQECYVLFSAIEKEQDLLGKVLGILGPIRSYCTIIGSNVKVRCWTRQAGASPSKFTFSTANNSYGKLLSQHIARPDKDKDCNMERRDFAFPSLPPSHSVFPLSSVVW